MAIDPSAQYPGKIDTTDPTGYPYGKAQNITIPGDATGTPFEKAMLNDVFGMQQALLDDATITPSGVPDKVGASEYLASVKNAARSKPKFNIEDLKTMKGTVGDVVSSDERVAGTGIGAGDYEIVVANPGNNEINPLRTDGTYLKLLGGSIDISQAGVVFDDATDNSTAINQCFAAFRRVTNEQANGSVARAQGLTMDNNLSVFQAGEGTLKLVDAATNRKLLTVNANDCFVLNGFWDGNRVAGSQATSSNWFDHALVAFDNSCTRSKVTNITGFNAAGIGISSDAGCSSLNIDDNTLYDVDMACIYVAENLHTTINDNDLTANIASVNSPNQHNCILVAAAVILNSAYLQVNNNNCLGMLSGHDTVNNLIAVRAYNSQINSNLTRGGSMGLTINRATFCAVNDNVILDVDDSGLTPGYGIELNGNNNSVVGNVIRGADHGIIASTTTDDLSNNTITGNSMLEIRRGIQIGGHSGFTCTDWVITGNEITSSEDCIYIDDAHRFTITSNFLETTDVTKHTVFFNEPSSTDVDTLISGNTLKGGANIYRVIDSSGGAVFYNNIRLRDNTYVGITNELPSFIVDANPGTGISYDKMVSGVKYEYVDVANNVVNIWARPTTPEGFVNVNKGSMCTSLDGNIYRKSTDGVSTGWLAM